MGESRSNPRSTQYKGTLPENLLGAEIHPMIRPSDEWLKAHPPIEGVPRQQPTDADQTVSFVLYGTWLCPSVLVPQERWPLAKVPLIVLHQMPLTALRAQCETAGMVFPKPEPALVDA